MRRILAFLTLFWVFAPPAAAQPVPIARYTVNLPVTCTTDTPASKCITAITVTNPDGSTISGGGGGGSSAVAQGSTTTGQTGGLTQCATTTGDSAFTVGTTNPCTQTATGRIKVGLSSNATNGGTAATTSEQFGGRTAANTQQAACVATPGVFCSPVAGTADRVITKTSLTVSTNMTVCPTATVPVTTEILATAGSVGIGLNGQTLTTAIIGTANTTPDMPLASANTYYLLPVAATNAITAYSGTAQIIVCVQTVRQ